MPKGPSTTRSGAPLPLLVPLFSCPPAIHAAQNERAGRAGCVGQRGRLYRWPAVSSRQPAAPAILHGLARRTAPQTQGAAARSRASRWTAQESPAGNWGAPAGL